MKKNQHKLLLLFYATFALTALVIIIDFAFPGRVINDEIINVKKELQQYYNAARNYHYSYKIITNEHRFSVEEDFVKSVQNHDKIEYSVSHIFKEVNWYKLVSSEKRAFSSMRIISGIVVPLLAIFSILVAYLSKRNLGTFVFVLQTLLIADLIYLLK